MEIGQLFELAGESSENVEVRSKLLGILQDSIEVYANRYPQLFFVACFEESADASKNGEIQIEIVNVSLQGAEVLVECELTLSGTSLVGKELDCRGRFCIVFHRDGSEPSIRRLDL